MDKDLGAPAETGTPFYTQLSVWNQDRSRLDRFGVVLRAFGYREDIGGALDADASPLTGSTPTRSGTP